MRLHDEERERPNPSNSPTATQPPRPAGAPRLHDEERGAKRQCDEEEDAVLPARRARADGVRAECRVSSSATAAWTFVVAVPGTRRLTLMVDRIERNKDLIQELVESTATHVGQIATIITSAVVDVAREIGEIISDGFEMREASQKAKADEARVLDADLVDDLVEDLLDVEPAEPAEAGVADTDAIEADIEVPNLEASIEAPVVPQDVEDLDSDTDSLGSPDGGESATLEGMMEAPVAPSED
ncbi:hypothetical protein ABLE94_19445 [Gordonia sp. VNK1]|uniref:hypothetical protein n=1 Tax=Gordonia oleivorans TaxID=3156618 RepID=UPI0032B45C73